VLTVNEVRAMRGLGVMPEEQGLGARD
jgi:hypothetical protein